MLNDAIYVNEFRKKTIPYPIDLVHYKTDSDRLENMCECVSINQYSGPVLSTRCCQEVFIAII